MKKVLTISFLLAPLWGQFQDTILRVNLQGVEVQEFLPPSVLRIDSFTTYQSGEWVFLKCWATLTDLSTYSGDILGFKLHGIKSDKASRSPGTTFTGFQVSGPDIDGYYTFNLVLRDGNGNLVSTIPILKNKLSNVGFKDFDNTSKALSAFYTAGPDANGYVYLIAIADGALGEEERRPPSDKFKGELRPKFDFYLWNISPNPVRNYAKIKFSLKEESEAEILIMDISGRKIKRIIKKKLGPGFYQISWGLVDESGKRVGPGTYFVKYKVKDKTFIKKILVLSE